MLTVLGKDIGGGDIHEMTTRPSEIGSDASRVSAVLEQPVVSQAIGAVFIPPALASQVRHFILIRS